jgi:hypothetical protein
VNAAEAAATRQEEIWSTVASGTRSSLVDSPPGAGSRHSFERLAAVHTDAPKFPSSSRPMTRPTT